MTTTPDHGRAQTVDQLNQSLLAEIDNLQGQILTGDIPQGGPLTADLAAGNHKITGLADPTAAQGAATKNYVDTALADVFWTYDFGVAGGAQGTIPLVGPAIPINAFVNAGFYQVITPFTSGGSATVALTTGEAAGDIVTASAYNAAAYTAGVHTPSVKKLTTASRQPAIVIAAADLTAGKIKVFLDISEGWG